MPYHTNPSKPKKDTKKPNKTKSKMSVMDIKKIR